MTHGQRGAGARRIVLVLVTYYVQSLPDVRALVEEFGRSSRLPIGRTIVIDNGGRLPPGQHGGVEVVPSDNGFWEFSAWSQGLDLIPSDDDALVVLLNDSFGRNWSIAWPGRRVIATMARRAASGRIAGWLDNFTRRQRRVNSRIVILPARLTATLKRSIDEAIARCRAREQAGEPLFDPDTQARLSRWFASQDGRWSPAVMDSRAKRVFVEHHLFDAVATDLLSLNPSTWLGSQIYGVARKVAGERR